MSKAIRRIFLLGPPAGILIFCWSLQQRVETGWQYKSKPQDRQLAYLSLGVAALICVPRLAPASREDLRSPYDTGGLILGVGLGKEAVSAWMVVLTAHFAGRSTNVPFTVQLLLCSVISFAALGAAYIPLWVAWRFRQLDRSQ